MRSAAAALVLALSASWLSSSSPSSPAAKPVSFAILEDYDKGDDLADVDRDFALFEELEIRTWRGSFGWDDYEPRRGRFEFEWLHRFAELAARRGIQLRPYLAYTPEWAGARGSDADAWNDAPRRTAEWARFTAALARAMRRHPHVLSFEIYNEENVKQWWDATPDRYAEVLAAGTRAIREAHPRARVLFGGLVFPDREWIERVCSVAAARSFDVLPLHAYPETWTPAGVTVENYLGGLAEFAAAADAACGRKSIWINETGFATTPGRSEREQAGWWVRAVATFLAHPRVEHIGVYEIKDLPPDRPAIGDAPNYHLGITRRDRTRKLAFYTVDMLTDLLDTGTLTVADTELGVRVLGGAGKPHAHLFARPDGDRVLIAWSSGGELRVALDVPRSASVVEHLLDGSPRPDRSLDNVALTPDEPRIFRVR